MKNTNKEQVCECKICHEIFTGQVCNNLLSKHLKQHFDVIENRQEYYDLFYKQPGDGFCQNEKCNNVVKFRNIILGYAKFCCEKCNKSSVQTKEICRQNMLDKYGVPSNLCGVHGTRQCDITLKERYGVNSPMEMESSKEKSKKTNLERRGTEHNWNGKFGERLCDITRMDRMTNEEWMERKCRGMMEKYGIDNFFKQRNWVVDCWREKWNVDNPMQVPEIFNKSHSSQKRTSYRLKKYTTKFGNEVRYQSKLELNFIEFCEENDIEIFDGDCIWYNFDGKRHRYFIDFKIKINENFQLIELKGMHLWYADQKSSGLIDAKNLAAIEYSRQSGYLPFVYYLDNGDNKENFGLGDINSVGMV